ncbi:MAG: M3 family oligoendopeptidase [Anaerolineae bacterium]|nr:M3 family oligoendopeptidase [Anaerolineae bacterium]
MTKEPTVWELADLMPAVGTADMEAALHAIDVRVQAFERRRSDLTADICEDVFSEILVLYEELYADVSALAAYSYLWFSEDTGGQDRLSFRARANRIVADTQNRTLFFTLWWRQLDDELAARLEAGAGDAGYFLRSLRLLKPYTLSEAEERIINMKDVNGVNSLLTIYDMITTSLQFSLSIDGEERVLTRGQLMSFVSSPDAEVRAAAYQELFRAFGERTDVLAEIYASRVRDWAEEQVKVRGFGSPISVRNLANDVPDAVVDTLLDVIRNNAAIFQRYFRVKAGALGVGTLRRYDLYAPLSQAEKTYPFDTAVQLIDESFRAFSPVLADQALSVLEDRHLHALIRPRKMDGAYCYGVLPGVTPWVLTNYDGKARDVSTLAHELGHAVHALMAADHSVLTFHSALPMAETASVFSEMLLTDRLLGEESDPAVRRTLLGAILDDAYATISRQGHFVMFERVAHQMIIENATPDALHATYREHLNEQFGAAVQVSDDFSREWTVIPHIYHTPFYCYAYAFGNLLVLALYRQYQERGQAFVPNYLRILAYGGSASPEHIIREAGFDMTSAGFWQSGFDLLSERLADLEALV